MKKRLFSFAAALILLFAVPSAGEVSAAEAELPEATAAGSGNYFDYLATHGSVSRPEYELHADLNTAFTSSGSEITKMPDSESENNTVLLLSEEQEVSCLLNIPESGFYNIKIEYKPVASKGVDIEFSALIDGKIPFLSAAALRLSRIWKDSTERTYFDETGNEYRPLQVETFDWSTTVLSASDEYRDDAYLFYFEAGQRTLTLKGVRESFMIGGVTLFREKELKSYTEYINELEDSGKSLDSSGADIIRIEGENADLKSDPTLYSSSDYSSCHTQPYDVRRSLQNIIGGENWSVSGQWIQWNFKAKKSGYYRFYGRIKQNYKSGSYSVRRLTIDGEVPFAEAAALRFNYKLGWEIQVLGGDEPMLIWLDEGEHTLRIEAVFGDFAEIFGEIENCISEMNDLYRKIMMITGSTPDALRDYKLERLLPQSPAAFKSLNARLKNIAARLEKLTGSKGSETAVIEKMALQLSDFAKDVETIPARLKTYNDNISSLAAWLVSAGKQPLLVDYWEFAPTDAALPKANAPWYKQLYNEVIRFFFSFVEDYDNISSNVKAKKEPVTLWLGVGRDQATAMQSIITNHFSAEYDIPVNLRLIDMNVLMRAVAADAGPDLALYQDQTTAINYALRNAVYDLCNFNDIDEILERFPEQAVLPFRLGSSLYGLPEQINYNLLFYRTDVLNELNLRVPKTWDEMYKTLTVLQKNKLELGVVSSFTTATTTAISPLFLSLLYQNNGSIYDDSGAFSVLNNQSGVEAFIEYCELYTKYGLSLKIDLLTRFRTGEAPLVINNFSFGNELSVSAPELTGLWSMALLPGTDSKGTVNHATTMSVTGTVMFSNAKNKENTWEFIKWWTGESAQTEYARQIESTLGRSGRWTSANLQALENSTWSTRELSVLKNQLQFAKSLPEVAGGYYTGRSVNNAIRTVVNTKSDPKETLYEFVKDINKEISLKRRELGLEK